MNWHETKPLEVVERNAVPVLDPDSWTSALRAKLSAGAHPVTLFGVNENGSGVRVWSVLAEPQNGTLSVNCTRVVNGSDRLLSLANEFPALNYFECELFEQTGVLPEGHPWLRPVRNATAWRRNGEPHAFYRVEGDEVHEVAVGPVHAGVIEPGHFRFQCHGEQILHLEIMLGYQRRGVEALLPKQKLSRQLGLVESIAGDSVIGHTTAFCAGMETLSGITLSLRDHAMRGIAAEMERIAMHLASLGGIATDIGFVLPAAAFGNLRTLAINLAAEICGSRFGRGWVMPGGIRFDADEKWIAIAKERLGVILEKFADAESLFFNSASTLSRIEDTGVITRDAAREAGLVGVAARASGLERDVRTEFPLGIYQYSTIGSRILSSGDVYARAEIRALEIRQSIEFVLEQIEHLPSAKQKVECGNLEQNALVISLTEGHRGEIAHVLMTDETGELATVKIKDPSFHNWQGLALAVRENGISDFPLCNKSFDLSYAGHDL